MPGDLSITPVVPVWRTQPQRTDTHDASAGAAPAAAANPAATPHLLNPDFHLDPGLNIVVLQFFNTNGDLTQSIPSQKQLDAYRADGGVTQAHSPPAPVSKVL